MRTSSRNVWLAGVDSCPGGWIVAFVRPSGDEGYLRRISKFAELLSAPEAPSLVLVDIPIGLPERSGNGGRPPEPCIRPRLGACYRSVFRIPSRRAVYEAVNPTICDHVQRFASARSIARETSIDNKAFSKQGFCICPKIVEVDKLLRARTELIGRVFETHPELAFWRLNAGRSLAHPKKVKRKLNPSGLVLRRNLLLADGIPAGVVNALTPQGAGEDDKLDALACAAIARRKYHRLAQPFPEFTETDAFKIPMAIWA